MNGAYHQLRELLTTFRLKLTEAGLLAALQSTLEEFEQRMGYRIGFDFQLSGRRSPRTRPFMWCRLSARR